MAELLDRQGRLDLVTAGTDAAMKAIDGMSQRLGRLELEAAAGGNGAPVYPSKKAHLLALYRQHGEHGRREVASRVAGELAEAAGLQPGTARAYLYEELARLAGDAEQAWHAPPGRAAHGPRREQGGPPVKTAHVLLTLPFHHLYLDALAVLMLAGVLAAVLGERHRAGCDLAGERGFRGGSGCGWVACDDTVSVSDTGRPSP